MLYKLVALFTFPILLIQGKRVKQNALKLPEAAGSRQGSANNKALPMLNILIIGDSSAAGVGVDHQDDALSGQLTHVLEGDISVSWQLVAKTGAQTKDMITMLSVANISSPIDIVITSLGVNDVTSLQSSNKWLAAQDKLHQYCLSTLNAKHIIVSGMPPLHRFPLLPQPLRWIMGSRAKQLDKQQLKKIKQQPNVSHQALPVDLGANAMAIDGFHPGAVAYKVWASSLRVRILQLKSRQS